MSDIILIVSTTVCVLLVQLCTLRALVYLSERSCRGEMKQEKKNGEYNPNS